MSEERSKPRESSPAGALAVVFSVVAGALTTQTAYKVSAGPLKVFAVVFTPSTAYKEPAGALAVVFSAAVAAFTHSATYKESAVTLQVFAGVLTTPTAYKESAGALPASSPAAYTRLRSG
ncbi:hypothetical protein JCM17823_23020 [Halorubrum gandharaense]